VAPAELRSVGILGGTFNPPHVGHLALARHARAELGLEQVLLIPAHIAPNKPLERDDPGPEHRLRMCRLAITDEPGLEASALEIERGGTSYTVDTLQAIHDTRPDAELTLILGADTALTLPFWREPERLLSLAGLAVAERDDLDARDVREALSPTALELGRASRITFMRMNKLAVSSSLVRDLVAAGRSVTELVGEAVADYIAAHGLYRATGASASVAEIGGAAS
jgi:nicotinate-nucleotide adenylyltransferase